MDQGTPIPLNMGPLGKIEGQIIGQMPGYGACDPLFRDAASALLPFRYTTVAFKLVVGGAAIGGDLTIAASVQVQGFTYGVGDDLGAVSGFTGIPAATGTPCQPDLTDSYKGGAPVEINELYVVVGMCVHILRPAELTARIAGAASGAWVYDTWVDEYEERVREGFMSHVWIEFAYGQNASRYRMSRPDMWPQMSGPAGSIISNGRPTAGVFLPFRAATVVNGRDQARQLTANVNIGAFGLTFKNNPIVPTQNDLYVPLTLQLVGFPVCSTDGGAPSQAGGGDLASQVAAVLQQMGVAAPAGR